MIRLTGAQKAQLEVERKQIVGKLTFATWAERPPLVARLGEIARMLGGVKDSVA